MSEQKTTCSYCQSQYKTRSALMMHLRTSDDCIKKQEDDGITVKRYIMECESCHKQFKSSSSFKYHLGVCKFKLEKRLESECAEKEALKLLVEEIERNPCKNDTLSNKIHSLEEIIKEKDRLLKEKDDLIIKLQNQSSKKKEQKHKEPRKIDKNLRELIWSKWIGEDIARSKCLCCKSRMISQFDFVCGHVEAVVKGGDDSVDNLRPICKSCNNGMKTMNMMEYIKHHKFDIVA